MHGEVVRCDGFFSRAAVAGCAVWFYLGKLIWPLDLCLVYPRWTIDDRSVLSYLPGVMLGGPPRLAWWQRRTWGRPVVMLIVCYVALLLPVLGFVNIYFMRYSLVADHWQYAAIIVPCAVLAGMTAALARQFGADWQRAAVGLALLAMLAASPGGKAGCTPTPRRFIGRRSSGTPIVGWPTTTSASSWPAADRSTRPSPITRRPWKSSPTTPRPTTTSAWLWPAADRSTRPSPITGRPWKSSPTTPRPTTTSASPWPAADRSTRPSPITRRPWKSSPTTPRPTTTSATSLAGRGQVDEAIAHYQKALEIKPDYAEAHNNLGIALAGRGQVDEAIAHYQKALEIKPDYAEAHDNLGNGFGRPRTDRRGHRPLPKGPENQSHFREAHNNLGIALAQSGQLDEAIAISRRH